MKCKAGEGHHGVECDICIAQRKLDIEREIDGILTPHVRQEVRKMIRRELRKYSGSPKGVLR